MSQNGGDYCAAMPLGALHSNESIEHALSEIEFNMADIELSQYVITTDVLPASLPNWKPERKLVERMYSFYGNPLRRRLLALPTELIFQGQLVVVKKSPNYNPVRCIVDSLPDVASGISVVTIDQRKRINCPKNIYFLCRQFARTLPPWLKCVKSASPFVWPDRYCLPCFRHHSSEWEIATEKSHQFRECPPIPAGSVMCAMVRITKAHQPHLYYAKPAHWRLQTIRFRELLARFYGSFKEELRLNANEIRVGLPVAFCAYNEWHRGEIVSLPGSLGLMKVFYLDEWYSGEVRCDMVFHLVKHFAEYKIGLMRIKLAGLLPPRRGWPEGAYEYIEEDCVGKDLFFMATYRDGPIYEGYLSHGKDAKTRLRSLGTEWVGDNLVRNFGAISLAPSPFEQNDDE